MNGIVRQEKFKHERIIRQLWFQMNDITHPNDKKRLDKRIQHHVRCIQRCKQLESATR